MAEMFTGKYNHSIDTKGRIIVPAKFKKNIGEEPVVSLGIDGCLDIYPRDRWEAFVESLDSLPGNLSKVRNIRRALMANSTECEIDKQGRILIPQWLREKVGLDKEAVFVGVGKKIELWNKEKFEAIDLSDTESLEELADGLSEYNISF
ncbi:MAG: division/cell wall cluster transcriptional repressor MraZ [Clostridiales bacterium]|nr:division/cell wall cluster transcriptional repressor MraZ [Clostridiales bacterium]